VEESIESEVVIKLLEKSVATRVSAIPYRDRIIQALKDTDGMVKIDLENVEYMSSAFADECVGIIVKVFDFNTLQQRISLINGRQSVLNTLGSAVLERVKMQMLGF
jgi:hypothetical protein